MAADPFLSPIIQKLIDFSLEEVKLQKGVEGELESLKEELEIIQPLLIDAEAKSEKGDMSDAVKAWVKQIRKEASRIEDVIDEYFYHVEEQEQKRENGFTMCFLCKASDCIKALKPRHEIASKIKDIKQSLIDIKSRGHGYGLKPLEHESSERTTDVECDPRLGALFVEDDELVGIESTSKELTKKLVEGTSKRLVISVVGEGGIGKTTLAKKVYNDEEVKQHFESARAWITVSQSYDRKKLLENVKRQVCKPEDSNTGNSNTIDKLIESLRENLRNKCYLIIFDDVWQENFWEDIKLAIPNNDKGSRIIITTRNTTVANSCKESPYDIIQNLQPWTLDFAWELFCKKAFRYEFQGKCPKELEKLSIEIVSKCQGLPLVIVAIASLLATKEKNRSEWEKVLDDLNTKVERNNSQFLTTIQKILSLSYYDLPYPLRSCFLYFGVFPEDYSIYDERLYRLWISEGFVKTRLGKTPEEVAEEYLNELVQRNMVTRDLWLPVGIGQGTPIRVHDLMRDVILSKTEEVCFCQVWDGKLLKPRGKGRRLTIYGSTENVLENVESSGVRSIFFFEIDDNLTEQFIASLFKKFKLLEVLDFGNAHVDTLPKELGILFHLKYLSLNSTNIKMLPTSISKLHKLQSLDIRNTLIHELPNEINMLTNLKHLLAYSINYSARGTVDFVHGAKIQVGFGNLLDLQTLALVEAHDLGLMKEFEKLRMLRWLGISKLTRETGRALFTTYIGKMNHLEQLFISPIDENEVLDLQLYSSSSSSPHFLRELVLLGKLEKLPGWILTLENLRGLCLAFSRLTNEPIKSLKGLPNLETLQLCYDAYEGEELHFEEGGFEKLKTIRLIGLVTLKVVKIDVGALPLLEQLEIIDCSKVEKISSTQHLSNLKIITIEERCPF